MGGEVVRKKQSEGERRWELGESEEERRGGGTKKVVWLRLSSSAGRKTRCC
jgi:hypothetical protein